MNLHEKFVWRWILTALFSVNLNGIIVLLALFVPYPMCILCIVCAGMVGILAMIPAVLIDYRKIVSSQAD